MELGVFLPHLRDAARQNGTTVQDEMILAAENGVRYLQVDGAYWLANEREIDELAERAGMRVGGLDYRVDLAHGQSGEEAERLLRLAAERGVKQVLIIPGFIAPGEKREDVMERIAEGLRPLARLAVKLGVTCSLEDYDDAPAPYGTWQELKWFMEHVEGLGCSFDTGNFAYFGQDAQEALGKLLPWVCIVHCKDRAAQSLAGETGRLSAAGQMLYPCAVGEGYIPMREMIAALKAHGFDGGLTIEHFDSARQRTAIAASAKNLTKWLGEL